MLLDNTSDPLEFGNTGIAHTLIQKAFRARDNGTFSSQPVQSDANLFWVAALIGDLVSLITPAELMVDETYRNTICQDVDLVPFAEEVQRGLRDADMGLNTNNHHFSLLRTELLECLLDLRNPPKPDQHMSEMQEAS